MNRLTELFGSTCIVVVAVLLLAPMLASAHDHEVVQIDMSLSSGDEVITEPVIQTVTGRPVELNSVTEAGGDDQDEQQLNVELVPAIDGDDVRLTGGIESTVGGDVSTSIDVDRSVVSGESFVIEIEDVKLDVVVQVIREY